MTAPVNFTVNSPVPQRLAGFTGAYQVMNLSSAATVWVGDDTNIQDGIGVPLAPGASMVRIFTGNLYVALGKDAQSVAAGSCPIALDPTIQQWSNPEATAIAILNAGVIIVDTPVTIVTGNIAAGNVTLGPFNVSTYQSLIVSTLGPGSAFTLQISWYTDAALSVSLGSDLWSFTAADTGVLDETIPCRGAYMRVTKTGAGTPNVTIIGSHRQWSPLMNNYQDRVLIGQTTNTAAGATTQVGPGAYHYDGPAWLTVIAVSVVGAAQPTLIRVTDVTLNLDVFSLLDAGALVGANAYTTISRSLVLPRNSWQVQLQNLGSVTRGYLVTMIAAPEGT